MTELQVVKGNFMSRSGKMGTCLSIAKQLCCNSNNSESPKPENIEEVTFFRSAKKSLVNVLCRNKKMIKLLRKSLSSSDRVATNSLELVRSAAKKMDNRPAKLDKSPAEALDAAGLKVYGKKYVPRALVSAREE